MEVILLKGFTKDLKVCPKHIQQGAGAVINELENAKNLQSSGVDYSKCEGLRKGENFYRIRVGGWRIGIALKHPTVIAMTILVRGKIYKKFPPK